MSRRYALWPVAMLCLALSAGCGRGEPDPDDVAFPQDSLRAAPGAPAASPSPSLVYRYEGLRVVVTPQGDRILLELPGRQAVLPRVPSASGARYSDGDITFWLEGVGEAVLEVDGMRYEGLRRVD